MRRASIAYALSLGFVVAAMTAGCKPQEAPPPEVPSSPPLAKTPREAPSPAATATPDLPPGHPPIGGQQQMPPIGETGLPAGHPQINPANASEGEKVDAQTDFEGIRLIPPDGWQAFSPRANRGFTPIAAFVLPHVEGDTQDATARLTYFPAMKNIPVEANLNRWYGMVSQPDGRPTKDVAKVEEFENNGVKVTLVDMTGNIAGNEGLWRMMAAVIQHPQGPHFLKVAGPEKTMAKWADSVRAYLQSAEVIP
jgi:hypothetical protein